MFCKNKFSHMFYTGILQGIFFMVVGFTDMVLVGYFFGEDGVSAIAVSGPLGSILSFCIVFFASGCRFIYPEKIGEYKRDEANEYFSTALTVSIILTIFFTILMFFSGERYFDIYKLSGDILDMGKSYIKYYKYVYVLSPLVSFIGQMVYCDGDNKLSAIANTSFVIGNIVFSILGAVLLGIEGIGLGTLISGFICLLIYCIHFFKAESTFKYKFYFSIKKQFEIIRFGFMESINSLFMGINGIVISYIIVNHIGSEYLSVNSIVCQSMGFMGFFSVATEAMLPLLNNYRGEKNNDGVVKIMGVTTAYIVSMGILLTLFMILIAPVYPMIFSMTDHKLISECVLGIRIVSLTYLFNGIQNLITTYYNASGHVVFATVVARCKDTVSYIVCFVVCGLLFGVHGLWIGYSIYPVVTFIPVIIILLISTKRGGKLSLPKNDDNIRSWDIAIDSERGLINVRDKAAMFLSEKNVPDNVIRKVEFLIEESLLSIRDHNEKDKKVLAEVTIICRKDIEVIIRDNGILYDLSDEDAAVTSFRDYILTRFYDKVDKKNNGMSMSFNRTRFIFEDVLTAKGSFRKNHVRSENERLS